MDRLPPLPAVPRPPARVGFPAMAVLAPIVGAVAIGIITRSAFVVLFAVLSPLIAIASMIDARRSARRFRRDEAERFDRECRAFADAIDRVRRAEREADDALYPVLPVALETAAPPGSTMLRIGVGPQSSSALGEVPLLAGATEAERRLAALVERARTHPARAIVVPRGAVAVRGRGWAADAVLARLEREVAVTVRRLSDAETPMPGESLLIVRSAIAVDVISPDGKCRSGRPALLSRAQLQSVDGERAHRGPQSIPAMVSWSSLHPSSRDASPRHDGAPIVGCDERGPAELDLERDGPHALVGGATGSGKSEFLRTLVLSWAARRSPAELQFLLIDFKGGATFADVAVLPHVMGLVTDLDPPNVERTMLSLRAELRRRERILLTHGVRDAAESPGLIPRLVVLVDEFAALIDTAPHLQMVFADMSARGRSLGVHIVVGTQHPAAVVRETVAANCAVRVAFRLPESAGNAFLGGAARALRDASPGRALMVVGGHEREIQVAVITQDDIAQVVAAWADTPSPPSPWPPPLPDRVGIAEVTALAASEEAAPSPSSRWPSLPSLPSPARPPDTGIPFGILDDPAELCRRPASWHPAVHGSVVVMGAASSGRSTALATLAAAARDRGYVVTTLPPDVPSAWSVLEQLIEHPGTGRILIADDLDAVVSAAGDRAPDFFALWDSATRVLGKLGGGSAASVGVASLNRSLVSGRFGVRLLLRALDADDHAAAGAPRELYDRAAPSGRGWWLERQVQVAVGAPPLASASQAAAAWWPPVDGDAVIIARHVDRCVTRWGASLSGHRIVLAEASAGEVESLGGAVAAGPRLFVGHPDDWQDAWGALSALRRTRPVVVVDDDSAALRVLLGIRTPPPPIDPDRGEAWLIEPAAPPRRVRLAHECTPACTPECDARDA